jgi:hypothetical protein
MHALVLQTNSSKVLRAARDAGAYSQVSFPRGTVEMQDQQPEPAPGDISDAEGYQHPGMIPGQDGGGADQADWREYEYLGGLYTFYLDLVVKGAGGYFVIVGGILTLVLTNVQEEPIVVLALLVPVLMSVLLALASRTALPKIRELRAGINEIGERLHVTVKPHVEILESSIRGSFVLLLIAAGFLAVLFAWIIAAA